MSYQSQITQQYAKLENLQIQNLSQNMNLVMMQLDKMNQ